MNSSPRKNLPTPLPKMVAIKVTVTPGIRLFIQTKAREFGISQSELQRRVWFDTIEGYIERGLYQMPKEPLAESPKGSGE
jgi:hypothetical protein